MEFIIPATKDLQPGLEKVQEFLHQVHFSFLSLYTIAKIKKIYSPALTLISLETLFEYVNRYFFTPVMNHQKVSSD